MTGINNTPNFEQSEKSRGVVLFAFSTDTVDYVEIADRASLLINHYLKLPVTLITSEDADPKFAYDNVVRINQTGGTYRIDTEHRKVQWKNFDRYLAYQFSPYYETLLLDTDYVILDNSLLKLFETEFDYKLMHHNHNDSGITVDEMGYTSLPYIWATVVLFRKTERARLFFELVGRVQRNYQYYRLLYNIREGNYRNDYAFAISNIILNGYAICEEQGIPWPIYSSEKSVQSIDIDSDFLKIKYHNSATVIPRQCVHLIDKQYLLSDNFKQLIEVAIESA